MSDFISRQALLKELTINRDGKRIPEADIDNFPITLTISQAKELIKNAPAVYDVDKVVEQLEELTGEECTLHECGLRSEHCKSCIAQKAIEIVKGGGVDE